MPIYFRNTPVKQPFLFDSIGYDWYQDPMSRPKGYPHFHYLQTEQGAGKIKIQGTCRTLNPGEGLLMAPFCLTPMKAPQKRNGAPAFSLLPEHWKAVSERF